MQKRGEPSFFLTITTQEENVRNYQKLFVKLREIIRNHQKVIREINNKRNLSLFSHNFSF